MLLHSLPRALNVVLKFEKCGHAQEKLFRAVLPGSRDYLCKVPLGHGMGVACALIAVEKVGLIVRLRQSRALK